MASTRGKQGILALESPDSGFPRKYEVPSMWMDTLCESQVLELGESSVLDTDHESNLTRDDIVGGTGTNKLGTDQAVVGTASPL